MAVTLDADPTSGTFNCYATLAQANTYHDARIQNSTWTSATNINKIKALLWATRLLDTLKWRGVRSSGTQNLEFPRRGLTYAESAPVAGFDYENYDTASLGYYTLIEIPSTTVPTFLKNATCELAMYLLDSDTTAPSGTEGFSRIKVDTIDIQIKSSDRERWLNDAIRELVWRFLAGGSKYSALAERVG